MKKLHARLFLVAGIVSLLAFYTLAVAHGGEDHSKEKKAAPASVQAGQADIVEIEKESQFLLEIRTVIADDTSFSNVSRFLSAVIPSTGGSAAVVTPQAARITSIRVKPGQKVRKGQVVAVAEQNLSATDQLAYASQRAQLEIQMETAKADYERLKSIEDIVAKKDLKEAEIRYRAARKAKVIFDRNARTIQLRAPVAGTVDNFVLTEGSQVGAGTELFRIVNLSKVWVQAQVYPEDAARINAATQFRVQSMEGGENTGRVRFISLSKTVEPGSQTLHLLLEVDNEGEQFRIGQFVTVFASTDQPRMALAVPSEALSDIGGKPVVFTHEEPETFRVHEVQPGASDGVRTEILRGLPAGRRVVVSGTYQVKSIVLNQ